MAYNGNADDFYEGLSHLKDSGDLDRIYSDPEKRLRMANRACDVIINQGSVVSGSDRGLFSHAMTGLPDLAWSPETREQVKQFEPFISGLFKLEGQFTGLNADIPFIPGKIESDLDEQGFRVPWHEGELPWWVYVRSQVPFTSLGNGGWGIDPDRTSVEYRVARNPFTNQVVGQVLARDSIGVNYNATLGVGGRPVRTIQIPTTRNDVVLYQAVRESDSLPELMPTVEPAQFGLDMLRPYAQAPDYEIETKLVVALSAAARIARHRGDYNGTPMIY